MLSFDSSPSLLTRLHAELSLLLPSAAAQPLHGTCYLGIPHFLPSLWPSPRIPRTCLSAAQLSHARSQVIAAETQSQAEVTSLHDKLRDAERRDLERAAEIKRLQRTARERDLQLMQGRGTSGGVGLGPGAGFGRAAE